MEAFKETNDQRLDDIERRMSADVVTTDKLDRINRSLDEYKGTVDQLLLKAARPQRGGGTPRTGAVTEHKSAFDDYMRRGEASICAAWKRRRSRSAPIATAAISCRRKSRPA